MLARPALSDRVGPQPHVLAKIEGVEVPVGPVAGREQIVAEKQVGRALGQGEDLLGELRPLGRAVRIGKVGGERRSHQRQFVAGAHALDDRRSGKRASDRLAGVHCFQPVHPWRGFFTGRGRRTHIADAADRAVERDSVDLRSVELPVDAVVVAEVRGCAPPAGQRVERILQVKERRGALLRTRRDLADLARPDHVEGRLQLEPRAQDVGSM